MIIRKMFKLFLNTIFIFLLVFTNSFAREGFELWVKKFQAKAIESGISKKLLLK